MSEHAPTPFGPVLIIGTGMMGCSLGRLIRGHYPSATVWGIDADAAVADQAAQEAHVSAAFGMERLERLLGEAGLVILATPIQATLDLLPVVAFGARSGAVVVDVGGSKRLICQRAAELTRFASGAVFFVGGHPRATAIGSGIEATRPSRFKHAPFLLCPLPSVPATVIETLVGFLTELSFDPQHIDPVAHDEIVGAASHAPHLVAVAVAAVLGRRAHAEQGGQPLHYTLAGRGFELLTAKAAANPKLWAEILSSNGAPVATTLREIAAELEQLAQATENRELAPLLLRAQCDRLDFERANDRHVSTSTRT